MFFRATAIKLRIEDIIDGELKKEGGDWDTYLLTPLGEDAGRVRVLGTVVSRFIRDDGKYAVLTIDDTTGTITGRAFNNDVALVERASEGDIVDVIGRVAEYQEERYISLESVSRITDPEWERVRKLELELKKKELGGHALQIEEKVEEGPENEDQKLKVKDIIEELDEGGGVKYTHILEESGISEEKLECILSELMEAGEVYEPNIGKFKRV